MDAEKILKISPQVIEDLIETNRVKAIPKCAPGSRREERWPFPGTVEVWLPEQCYGERHVLATLHNLSPHGLAMRARRPVDRDTKISLAIHQPEMSCYGHAIVRHCTQAHVGYLIGVEFLFPPESNAD
ncbi:MAG: PilZ domain-containing protein [Phycisphaerales bacterium]|nr:PilZ domain-containing protein [Phycisphaerales bacterium]